MKGKVFWSGVATLLYAMSSSLASAQCFEEKGSVEDLSTAGTGLMDGFNGFAVDLFKKTVQFQNTSTSHVFLSPLNVWMALTILYLGTKDPTRSELGKTLGFGQINQLQVAKQMMEFRAKYLSGRHSATNGTIFAENNIYVQEGEPVQDCITKALHLDLDVMKVNVAEDASLRQVINGINVLVDLQTNGQIEELIPMEYVDPSTRLLVMNTASFYGYWGKQFRPVHTEAQKFLVTPNSSVDVDMMHQKGNFRFANSSELECTLVELPFRNSDVSVVVLLPNANDAEELMTNLNATTLEEVVGQMQERPISLALPKLQIEQVIEMRPALLELGITTIFDPKLANLTGYSEKPGFALKGMRHLPFIEFNERGTTELEEVPQRPAGAIADDPLPFTVNRPFVFLLRHTGLKKILFTGLIREPMF